MRLSPLAVLALLASPPALAAWPEDVNLSGMTTQGGVPILDTDVLGGAYARVIRELGAAVGTTSTLAPHTLGASGFEVSIDTTLAFTSSSARGGDVAPWERVHTDEDPGPFLYAPGIMIRKGLPFSMELGVVGRWIGSSRQGTFGGFFRAGLVEGHRPWPNVGVKLGYTGYIGNDELELGVFELAGSLGGEFHVGGLVKNTHVSPFAEVALLVVTAAPLLDDETAIAIGATAFGRRSANPELESAKAIPLARFSGGFEIVTGPVLVRLSGGYTLSALGHAAVAIGFSY